MYLVSSCNKTFDCESLKAFKSLKEYKYFAEDLVRNVYACHIPANDLVAIKAHCLSSLKANTTYFTFLLSDGMVKLLLYSVRVLPGREKHALMFYLEDRMRQKNTHLPADASSTGTLQQWHMLQIGQCSLSP